LALNPASPLSPSGDVKGYIALLGSRKRKNKRPCSPAERILNKGRKALD